MNNTNTIKTLILELISVNSNLRHQGMKTLEKIFL